MRLLTRTIAAVAVVLAAAASTTPSAGAAPLERGTFEDRSEFLFDDCGRELHASQHLEGRYVIKAAQPITGGEFFRLQQQASFHATITDPASGRFLTIAWRTTLTELPGRMVTGEPDVFTFRTHESGLWDVWRDESGQVRYRSTGNVVMEYVFDSLGDGAPGGAFLDVRLIRTAGSFDTFDVDFCALALKILA